MSTDHTAAASKVWKHAHVLRDEGIGDVERCRADQLPKGRSNTSTWRHLATRRAIEQSPEWSELDRKAALSPQRERLVEHLSPAHNPPAVVAFTICFPQTGKTNQFRPRNPNQINSLR